MDTIESKKLSPFKVTKKAMRPANDKEECFYCKQPVGCYHTSDCVLVKKKVKVKAVVEYDVDVPASWTKEEIEFHRNESSWCADNMIRELEKVSANNGCLCPFVRFECLRETSKPYLEE